MEIGFFIKLNRIKQNITQGELAEGIVSESYLSKIENQKTEASKELLELLCARLGVIMHYDDDFKTREKCKKWFSLLCEGNDTEEITLLYQELQAIMDNHFSDIHTLFELHKIRYFTLIDEGDLALEQLKKLKEVVTTFDVEKQYYWYKFKGNFHVKITENFIQALEYFKIAHSKVNQFLIQEQDIADLKYYMSLTYGKLRFSNDSIDYAKEALEIFQQHYNYNRCAKTHILIGIAYRRIKKNDKAIENYDLALRLAQAHGYLSLIQLTNLNLGHLYETKGNNEKSFYFYNEVVKDPNSRFQARLKAIISLTRLYYLDNKTTAAINLVTQGKDLLAKENSQQLLYIEKSLAFYDALLQSDNDSFAKIANDELLPLLKKQQDYANIVNYATMAGNHFESMKKYKLAAQYYKLVNNAYAQLIKI
ncbi:helix-turn-helix domain-containing protein [Radiobacillus sp. PE A8.2]|uniref:helix-turn-helix domain-containing protein n=1 Tax=Radiobacillus sp. PE A8.2 TaxID=3380349 RepID=UPI00388DF51C